ncbi:MAG: energy transducer TonB [Bacteroidetes bacterium]|nr:energy transducer TonB [Bacteroidota bacterium]
MKTLKSILIITLLTFSTTSVMGRGPIGIISLDGVYTVIDECLSNDVREQVKEKMDYPEFAKESKLEGVTWVTFSVKNDGKVIVLQVVGSNRRLNDYVQETMNEIVVQPVKGCNVKQFKIKFVFLMI